MKIPEWIFGILCYSFMLYLHLKNSSAQLYHLSIFWHFHIIAFKIAKGIWTIIYLKFWTYVISWNRLEILERNSSVKQFENLL